MGAANWSLRKASKPIAWTCATSSAVGPKVDCSRKRTVSASEGCASAWRMLMTAQTHNTWKDQKSMRPTRNIRLFMVTPPTVRPPQRGRLRGHARRQGVRGDGTVVIATMSRVASRSSVRTPDEEAEQQDQTDQNTLGHTSSLPWMNNHSIYIQGIIRKDCRARSAWQWNYLHQVAR